MVKNNTFYAIELLTPERYVLKLHLRARFNSPTFGGMAMRIQDALKLGTPVLAVLALVTFVPTASASVVGHLTFAECPGDGVVVSLGLIDFLPPLGGTGCIAAGAGTTITFSSGSIAPAELGTVNDLSSPPTLGQNTGFITFSGVSFDLVGIGPGSSNTACAALPVNGVCSAVAGSPFLLQLVDNALGVPSTSIALAVSGVAMDGTSPISVWSGAFTTQISGQTPAQIQHTIEIGGSILSSFSFDGLATATPEPVSMALIGGGLIALAFWKKRKSQA
jgi:hypothetical protein